LEEETEKTYEIYAKYYYGKDETDAYVTVILFPDVPPKQIIRVFGPIRLRPSSGEVFVTAVKMPEGLFTAEKTKGK
ncbi:MAG: hypothetical protein D6713_04505, partial [Deltaproteobacteria bacterium]